MRPHPARHSRAGVVLLVATALVGLLAPVPSLASHWIVDQAGGGDYTTIQAALDAARGPSAPETILVLPGQYEEDLVMNYYCASVVLATGGAEITRIRSLTFPPYVAAGPDIEGLTFVQQVQLSYSYSETFFTRCRFEGRVEGSNSPVFFEDCDFYGRCNFLPYEAASTRPSMRNSRFHGAPLCFRTGDYGDLQFVDCTFEGPADTLVYDFSVNQSNFVHFTDCRFEDARKGLVVGWIGTGGIRMNRCVFSRLSEGALVHEQPPGYYGIWEGNQVLDSRFDHCGTAVWWRDLTGWGRSSSSLHFVRDTVAQCYDDGMVVNHVGDLLIDHCVVEAGEADGLVLMRDQYAGPPPSWAVSRRVSNSRFTDNRGAGLAFRDTATVEPEGSLWPSDLVQSCTFAHNGDGGLDLQGRNWSVQDCVSYANGGDGFVCTTLAPGAPARLTSNTSALNQGAGFRIAGPAAGDSLRLVQRNLAALNAGDGFRMPPNTGGSFAFNDAWGNYAAQYAGAWSSADSNLTVDPRFCNLGAGDLGLQQGSPCGAGGVYGLIGALPESCPNLVSVGPSAPGTLAFSVRPTVARGEVEFVPPASGPAGRVELFDLTGRRVWGGVLGPATGPLRWRGQGEAGRAQPGLYWVRFTRPGESATRRLVWLE